MSVDSATLKQEGESHLKQAEFHLEEAIKCLKKGIEFGNIEAIYKFGLAQFIGLGTEENHFGAVAQFRLAADKEHGRALYNLGICYELGLGAPENKKLAYKMYKKGDEERDDSMCRFRLGDCFDKGIGIDKDEQKALLTYIKASLQNNKWAHNKVGAYYLKSEDTAKSFNYFKMAADEGNPAGYYNMAWCYAQGIGVEAVNSQKAFEYYTVAANMNYVPAVCNLAYCYAKGFGTAVNPSKALELYTEAANHHHVDAMYNVGLCYENGTGCTRNIEEAKRWYKKAVYLTGHGLATDRLNNLEGGLGKSSPKPKRKEDAKKKSKGVKIKEKKVKDKDKKDKKDKKEKDKDKDKGRTSSLSVSGKQSSSSSITNSVVFSTSNQVSTSPPVVRPNSGAGNSAAATSPSTSSSATNTPNTARRGSLPPTPTSIGSTQSVLQSTLSSTASSSHSEDGASGSNSAASISGNIGAQSTPSLNTPQRYTGILLPSMRSSTAAPSSASVSAGANSNITSSSSSASSIVNSTNLAKSSPAKRISLPSRNPGKINPPSTAPATTPPNYPSLASKVKANIEDDDFLFASVDDDEINSDNVGSDSDSDSEDRADGVSNDNSNDNDNTNDSSDDRKSDDLSISDENQQTQATTNLSSAPTKPDNIPASSASPLPPPRPVRLPPGASSTQNSQTTTSKVMQTVSPTQSPVVSRAITEHSPNPSTTQPSSKNPEPPAQSKTARPITEILKELNLENYAEIFKNYGIETNHDLKLLNAEDWDKIQVKELHKRKLLQTA